MNCVDKDFRHCFWVVDDNTTETDVHGGRAVAQELSQLRRRCILGRLSEKEPTNVCSRK